MTAQQFNDLEWKVETRMEQTEGLAKMLEAIIYAMDPETRKRYDAYWTLKALADKKK